MNDDLTFYPSPTLAVTRCLEQFQGWSKYFARSLETIEEQDILMTENEPGFWEVWSRVRSMEYFREEVEETLKAYRKEVRDKRGNKELKRLLAKALLQEGWRPPKTKILQEMRAIRREKRECLEALGKRRKKHGSKKS